MRKGLWIPGVAVLSLFVSSVLAVPLADMKIRYKSNKNGTYTYLVVLENLGPVLPDVTTPPFHTVVDWSSAPPMAYNAGGKYLTDDENLVLFGIDTGIDDVVVTRIGDAGSVYHGTAESGFFDSDGDGIPNTVVAWHLPFYGWTLDQTVRPGEKLIGLTFTADKLIEKFNFWVGGSDDAVIWNDQHTMVEDSYGIFDATLGEYVASFFERRMEAKPVRWEHECVPLQFGKFKCD